MSSIVTTSRIAIRTINTTLALLAVASCIQVGCADRPEEPARLPDSRPSEWAYQQRTFPHGYFNQNAYKEAYAAVDELRRVSKAGMAAEKWELAGPTNVGGRITDVEFDPLDPDIVYASAATGGVFKSTDKGETWRAVFDGYAIVNVATSAYPKVIRP